MNQQLPTVYSALASKQPNAPNNFIYKLSIDPKKRKIFLDKDNASGFLSFDTTYIVFTQDGLFLNIGLWSLKNKRLLGTLGNKEGLWTSDDIHEIANKLRNTGMQVKETPPQKPATPKTNQPSPTLDFSINLKDNSSRANTVNIIYWIFTGLLLAVILIDYATFHLLREFQAGEVNVYAAKLLRVIKVVFSVLFIGFTITGIIVFLNWFRRAYANLRRLGLRMKYQDNIIVWSFFIPPVFWYVSYAIMTEIWLKPQKVIKKIQPAYRINWNTTLVFAWWVLFIVAIIANVTLEIWLLNVTNLSDAIMGNELIMIAHLMLGIASVSLIILVKKISKIEALLSKAVMTHQITAIGQ